MVCFKLFFGFKFFKPISDHYHNLRQRKMKMILTQKISNQRKSWTTTWVQRKISDSNSNKKNL